MFSSFISSIHFEINFKLVISVKKGRNSETFFCEKHVRNEANSPEKSYLLNGQHIWSVFSSFKRLFSPGSDEANLKKSIIRERIEIDRLDLHYSIICL